LNRNDPKARGFSRLCLPSGLSSRRRDRVISEKTARKLVREALVAMGDDWSSARSNLLKDYWAPEFLQLYGIIFQVRR